MDADFSIDVDPSRDLVRLRLAGFFSHADIARFEAARASAHRALTCGPNRHVTVTDVRGMKIQSQDMVTAFRELLAAPEYRSRRLAFITGPSLTRTQLQRAIGSRDARCFSDPAEALAYVLSDTSDALAA